MAFISIFVLQSSRRLCVNSQTNTPQHWRSIRNTQRTSTGGKLPFRINRRRSSKWLLSSTESEKGQCLFEEKLIKEVTEVVSGVDINVRLTSLGGRKRRISGGLDIEAPVKRVWEVMTDYEKLPEILPNIVECKIISDEVGNKNLEQVIILSRTFNIRSRIVVRVIEDYMKALRFLKLQSRDFEEFDGNYLFTEIESGYCRMEYSLDASPNLLFPISLVERKILKEVPQLLANIRQVALTRHRDGIVS